MSGKNIRTMILTGMSAIMLAGLLLVTMKQTTSLAMPARSVALDVSPPATTVRLIFIHHSTGENWLADDNGGLGIALMNNNYFVSDTNYGWGAACPGCQGCDSSYIGSCTDIGHWWEWFRGPNSATFLSALYAENGQNASYSRLANDPGGPNEIILFKSCFPNSDLQGSPSDSIPPIGSNPLRGQSSDSEHHTIANAKGIYIDLLNYFQTRPDKLFVAIVAPPRSDPTNADNARAFSNWLINEWLIGYPLRNVAVFDLYNVLTTNGGDPTTNDLNQESGNHHRWWHNAVQHKTDGDDDGSPNVLEYPTDDDHPSQAGNLKATGEFVTMLNIFYSRWQSSVAEPSLTLVSPNGGESWPVNSLRQIRWNTTGSVPQVSLAYSTDGFSTIHSIASSIDNSGIYTWTTPLTPTLSARVRVSSVISPATVYDISDADFTLYDPSTLTNTVCLPIVVNLWTTQP